MMAIAKLRDKATLVKLTQRSLGTTKRESGLTNELQEQKGDKGLVVLSKLFQDKNNPVNAALKMTTELYTYHRTHTLPYEDGGRRLLPNSRYLQYSQGVAERKQKMAQWLKDNIGNYDLFVRNDIAYRRSKGNASMSAHPDDYPNAERLTATLEPIILLDPVPDESHFLFDLSDEDRQNFELSMQERFNLAQTDAVRRVMEPLEKLLNKLENYTGGSEERFHQSLVGNVVEGAQLAKELTLEGSSQYFDAVQQVQNIANSVSVDSIRENAPYRDRIKDQLSEVQAAMAMFAPKV